MRKLITISLFFFCSLSASSQGLKAYIDISDKLEVLSRFRLMVFSASDTINLFYFNEINGQYCAEKEFPFWAPDRDYTAVIFYATDMGPWHNEFIDFNISSLSLKYVSVRVNFARSKNGKDYLEEFSVDYVHNNPSIAVTHLSEKSVGQKPRFEIINNSNENIWVYRNMPARFFIEEDFGYKMRIVGKNVPTLTEDIPIQPQFSMKTDFVLKPHEKPFRYRFPLHNKYTIYLTNKKDQHIIPKSYKEQGKTWKVVRKVYEIELEYDVTGDTTME